MKLKYENQKGPYITKALTVTSAGSALGNYQKEEDIIIYAIIGHVSNNLTDDTGYLSIWDGQGSGSSIEDDDYLVFRQYFSRVSIDRPDDAHGDSEVSNMTGPMTKVEWILETPLLCRGGARAETSSAHVNCTILYSVLESSTPYSGTPSTELALAVSQSDGYIITKIGGHNLLPYGTLTMTGGTDEDVGYTEVKTLTSALSSAVSAGASSLAISTNGTDYNKFPTAGTLTIASDGTNPEEVIHWDGRSTYTLALVGTLAYAHADDTPVSTNFVEIDTLATAQAHAVDTPVTATSPLLSDRENAINIFPDYMTTRGAFLISSEAKNKIVSKSDCEIWGFSVFNTTTTTLNFFIKDIDGNDVMKCTLDGETVLDDGSQPLNAGVGPTVFKFPLFVKGGFAISTRETGTNNLTTGLTANVIYRELSSNSDLSGTNTR